jgi:hypothetical protein
MLERLNEEIKRRTRVVRPNRENGLRLGRALGAETHEGWLEKHRYLNMQLLAEHERERFAQTEELGRLKRGRKPRGVHPMVRRLHDSTCTTCLAPEGALLHAPGRECPRQESNLCTRFRKPLLYPLSYGGAATDYTASHRRGRIGRSVPIRPGEEAIPASTTPTGTRWVCPRATTSCSRPSTTGDPRRYRR